MKSPSKDVLWFHENAGLVLSDLELCRNGGPPESYWDTAEVHGAALGYTDLYFQGEFDRRKFDSEEYLVRCLMASGWYGKIHMLEPHKYEFITRLGHFLDFRDRDLQSRRQSPTNPDDFVRSAIGSRISSSAQLTDIDRIIKEQSGKADALFKAIQSLGSFEQRISIWRKMQLLELSYDTDFDYSQVLEGDPFGRLRNKLDSERPETPINNFTDAAALCLLHSEVASAVSKKLPIPILFDSGGLMHRAVESLRSEGFLTYKNKEENSVPVLRKASYYLLRASVWIPDRFGGASNREERISELREMWRLTDKYITLASQVDAVTSESFIDIEPKLAEKIFELRRLWFLDRVWLPFAINPATVAFATPFLEEERRVLANARELADSERYREAISRDVRELRRRFVSGARRYTQLSKTWMRIHESFSTFVANYSYLVDLQPKRLASIFGLVRFGLSEEIERDAEERLWLLIGPDEIRKKTVREILILCLAAVRGDGVRKTPPDWLLVVLWVLEDDLTLRNILRLRRHEGRWIPVWMDIIYGASLLRMGAGEARVEEVISNLTKKTEEDEDPNTRAQAMIGLSYLNFHIWENENKTRLWSFLAFVGDGSEDIGIKTDARVREALNWALRARGAVRIDSSKYVYALNLYVYYATEGANENEFTQVERYAAELLGFRENRELWQYRFSDTLARFYHRRAMKQAEGARQELLRQALQFIDEAAREGKGDRKVMTYQQQLKLFADLQ